MICSGGTFVWFLWCIVFPGNVMLSSCCYDLCCGCDSFVVFSNSKATVPSVFSIAYSWKHSFALVFHYIGCLWRYVFVIFVTLYGFAYVFPTLTQFCSLMFLQTLDCCTGTKSCFKHFLNLFRNNCLFISLKLIAKCLLKVSAIFLATCCIIPHICQINLTNACFYQMPRTKGDKGKVGMEYISKLSSQHVCKNFCGGNTNLIIAQSYHSPLEL